MSAVERRSYCARVSEEDFLAAGAARGLWRIHGDKVWSERERPKAPKTTEEAAARRESQRPSYEAHRQQQRRHAGTKWHQRQERDAPKARKRTSQPHGADGQWKRSGGSTGRSRKPMPQEPRATTTTPSGEIWVTVVLYCFGLGAAAAGVWLVLQIPNAVQAAFSAIPKTWLVGIIALVLLALWSPRLVVIGLALLAACGAGRSDASHPATPTVAGCRARRRSVETPRTSWSGRSRSPRTVPSDPAPRSVPAARRSAGRSLPSPRG